MKKTLMALMVVLLPVAASAQLISVQQGTGRVETKKVKKDKKAKESPKVKKAEEFKDIKEPTMVKTDNGIEASIQADIVSHYIWRGQDLAGFSLQPNASISWKGLSLTAGGSASLDRDDYQELDLTLGYQLGPFNIGVSDYWCTGIDPENRYIYYDTHNGAHKFEGNLGFTCKYFSLQGYCYFWGNDFKIRRRALEPLKRAYSTYIEFGVPFRLGNLDWQLTVGGTPMESAGAWEEKQRQTQLGTETVTADVYEYAEGPACCVASLRCTKDLNFGTLRLPIFAELNTNPYLSKATFILGVSIIPW